MKNLFSKFISITFISTNFVFASNSFEQVCRIQRNFYPNTSYNREISAEQGISFEECTLRKQISQGSRFAQIVLEYNNFIESCDGSTIINTNYKNVIPAMEGDPATELSLNIKCYLNSSKEK